MTLHVGFYSPCAPPPLQTWTKARMGNHLKSGEHQVSSVICCVWLRKNHKTNGQIVRKIVDRCVFPSQLWDATSPELFCLLFSGLCYRDLFPQILQERFPAIFFVAFSHWSDSDSCALDSSRQDSHHFFFAFFLLLFFLSGLEEQWDRFDHGFPCVSCRCCQLQRQENSSWVNSKKMKPEKCPVVTMKTEFTLLFSVSEQMWSGFDKTCSVPPHKNQPQSFLWF